MIEAPPEAPARYSVNDPDYDWEIGAQIEISLDGVKQDRVIEYDADAGTVLRYKLNEEGQSYIDPDDPEKAATELLTGNVTARMVKRIDVRMDLVWPNGIPDSTESAAHGN